MEKGGVPPTRAESAVQPFRNQEARGVRVGSPEVDEEVGGSAGSCGRPWPIAGLRCILVRRILA